ncbi:MULTISPECIES: S8 family serine peptidase [unclassified Paraburkholderia]|uniref:subtilisin-like serine protease QhpE n=1 Tax=unclassified Paraburkholderia TaxID=2615204 RepID=UPI002AB6B3E0|nr:MULTISPECIES: S8 family serine peptidase [unclassified Paraburkholderia]
MSASAPGFANNVSVGVVDSGCSDALAPQVDAALRFWFETEDRLRYGPAERDRIGHGTAICAAIAAAAPNARLHIAQVFHSRSVTSAPQIAHAIQWLVVQRVRIINLSLGVRTDRTALREACASAIAQGIIIFAASPARGNPVFPASYPEVIRVTGDARCSPCQWSSLDSEQADFGAIVSIEAAGSPAGASIACAALSGHAARWLGQHRDADRADLLAYLRANASFIGRERRALSS